MNVSTDVKGPHLTVTVQTVAEMVQDPGPVVEDNFPASQDASIAA